MKTLQRALSATFKPTAPRLRDVHRRDRAEAKQIAQESCVEIEQLAGGGFNVWPPAGGKHSCTAGPFAGDHYCGEWAEVLVMVRTYASR